MEIIQLLLGILVLNVVYHTGQLIWSLHWGIHHQHYFIGRGPKLFSFQLRNIKFTLGIYIPLLGLAKIYEYGSGEKKRAFSPWEFTDYPIWKRLTVTIGGVISLIIAGIIIFSCLAYMEKVSFIHKDEVNKYGIYPSEPAAEAGFHRGDKILLMNGKEYENFTDLLRPVAGTRYTIVRDGHEQELLIDAKIADKAAEHREQFISVRSPFKIKSVISGSPADNTGLKVGDQIRKINQHPVICIEEYKSVIESDEDGIVDLLIQRQGAEEEILFTKVALNNDRLLGFSSEPLLQLTIRKNSLSSSVQIGITRSYTIIESNLRSLYKLFSTSAIESKKSMGGPIQVASLFGDDYLWRNFWNVTALLAIVTAMLNLFPLPNAAFWYMVPLLYEALSRKVFSYQAFLKITRFGYYVVIALMVFAIMGDMVYLFR
jgi:regulator of sigma E protease